MFKIQSLNQKDFSKNILSNLKPVLKNAYFNSHMYESFLKDLNAEHNIFQGFLGLSRENTVVGCGILEDIIYKEVQYLGYPPVHLKRFTVSENCRGQGVGSMILDKILLAGKNKYKLDVVFGETNEISGILFYGKKGALFSLDSIKNYSKRNGPEENINFFCKYITDRDFLSYRYPNGNGLSFVFCLNEETKDIFQKQEFYTIKEILAISKDTNN